MTAEREKPMAEADVTAWLAQHLPHWKLDGGWVRRTYKTAIWRRPPGITPTSPPRMRGLRCA